MAEFARTLGRVLGRPAWLPVPETALRLVLGEAADAVVPGQRVVPRAAREAGYAFAHGTLREALEDLVGEGA
jgi:NAD dependent epimerase/dehydratase family enzyme